MKKNIMAGDLVVADGKLAVITELTSPGQIMVKESETGRTFETTVADIQIIPDTEALATNLPRYDPTDAVQAEKLIAAGERALVVKNYLEGIITAKSAAEILSLQKSAFYNLVTKYNHSLGAISVIGRQPGPRPGSTRTSITVQNIIGDCFVEYYKGKSASYSNVWKQVQAACSLKNITPPGLSTVQRFAKTLDAETLHRQKHGLDATQQIFQPRPGVVHTKHPLQVAQIDHTQVDLILRAKHDRTILIGRPWLTIMIDVHSRVILGYYLTMFPPSLISVQQTIGMAALPKKKGYLISSETYVAYPYYGLPSELLMDNAKEFRSPTLEAALHKYGTKPKWRIIGKKHMGGHIERLIGTFMTTAVHFLPGSTFSNTQQRKGYDSERLSTLTFDEFAEWFAGQVLVYHGTVHTALKCSPKDSWERYYSSSTNSLPAIVSKPTELYLDFLPQKHRPVRNNGIQLNCCRYYSPELNPVQGKGKLTVKFDPYDLSHIWAKVNDNYVKVPLITSEHSFKNFEAYRINRAYHKLAPPGTVTDENALRQISANNEIVKKGKKLTKDNKQKQKQDAAYSQHQTAINNGIPLHLTLDPAIVTTTVTTVLIDVNFSKPPQLFDVND